MILIYSARPSVRLSFVCDWIFHTRLKQPYRLVHTYEAANGFDGPVVVYGDSGGMNGSFFHIPAVSLLWEEDIRPKSLSAGQFNGHPVIFTLTDQKSDINFDVLAAIFWILTRYEEYLPFEPDTHGRFTARASALRNWDIAIPLADHWASILLEEIARLWPGIHAAPKVFQTEVTYDIDVAYAVLGRPLWMQLGKFFNYFLTGRWGQAGHYLRVGLGQVPDPYDSYAWQRQLKETNGHVVRYFILSGKRGDYDRNLDVNNPKVHQLLRQLMEFADSVGLHPSYGSFGQPRKLALEKARLEEALGQTIMDSRQHYLRFRLPDTYRALLRVGIHHDYSMGFADKPGFRAGTSSPFPWFDVERNEITTLTIHPFAAMDGTLAEHLKLSPEEGLAHLLEIKGHVQRLGGCLSLLWHNHSAAGADQWVGWQKVLEEASLN